VRCHDRKSECYDHPKLYGVRFFKYVKTFQMLTSSTLFVSRPCDPNTWVWLQVHGTLSGNFLAQILVGCGLDCKCLKIMVCWRSAAWIISSA